MKTPSAAADTTGKATSEGSETGFASVDGHPSPAPANPTSVPTVERPSRWSALRTSHAAEEAEEHDSDLEDDRGAGDSMPLRSESARTTLVALTMMAALTSDVRAKLRTRTSLALTVTIPSTSWLGPVKKFFDNGGYGRKWDCYARDGSSRSTDKPSVGNDGVATALAAGQSVVGIAIDPAQVLPSTLVSAADIRLSVKLDARVVRKAIRKIYGQTSTSVAASDLAGLDIHDIEAAMRPDTRVRDVVARIAAASKIRGPDTGADGVPDLETAVEYGAARVWGLALARDMREFRAGTLPWGALDRGAIFFSGPGMGKSVLARSLARACEANLVVGSIGELFATSSGNLDGVIKAMRELFARAVAAAPSILFLDEIDGLPSRASLD